jgi:hypothetical protein
MEVHAVQTWFDRKHGVMTVDDDVQNVVRDLRAIDERIVVYYNEQTSGFDIVERCLDGRERLVFSVDELDQRAVIRLRSADHWHGEDLPNHVRGEGEDFVAEVDAHNEGLERQIAEDTADKIAYAGEGLAWALDNTKDRSSVNGSILVPKDL